MYIKIICCILESFAFLQLFCPDSFAFAAVSYKIVLLYISRLTNIQSLYYRFVPYKYILLDK